MNVMKNKKAVLSPSKILPVLQKRFENHMSRHAHIKWSDVESQLVNSFQKLGVIYEMEISGGEPDVVGMDDKTGEIIFFDCSKETPTGRRSLCYDKVALEGRKKHPPKNDAMTIAQEMGITLLNEEQYFFLQSLGDFDLKTSSWLLTPINVREKGGALFGDKRYGRCFIYHNGADSYYAARGFRGWVKI